MASAGQSTEQARQAQDVDAIPTLAWSARPDGSAEFLNRRWLDYTGLSAEEASDWGWTAALHTEDPGKLHHASVGIVSMILRSRASDCLISWYACWSAVCERSL